MKKFHYLTLSVLFLAAISLAFGADFWESKQYEKWSQKDCSKLLTDSPWAKDLTEMDSSVDRSSKATAKTEDLES